MEISKFDLNQTKYSTKIDSFPFSLEKIPSKQQNIEGNMRNFTDFNQDFIIDTNTPTKISDYLSENSTNDFIRSNNTSDHIQLDYQGPFEKKVLIQEIQNSYSESISSAKMDSTSSNTTYFSSRILKELYSEPGENWLSLYDSTVFKIDKDLNNILGSSTEHTSTKKSLILDIKKLSDQTISDQLRSYEDLMNIKAKYSNNKEAINYVNNREGLHLGIMISWIIELTRNGHIKSILASMLNFVYYRRIILSMRDINNNELYDVFCAIIRDIARKYHKKEHDIQQLFLNYAINSIIFQKALVGFFKELINMIQNEQFSSVINNHSINIGHIEHDNANIINDQKEFEIISKIIQTDINLCILDQNKYDENYILCNEYFTIKHDDMYQKRFPITIIYFKGNGDSAQNSHYQFLYKEICGSKLALNLGEPSINNNNNNYGINIKHKIKSSTKEMIFEVSRENLYGSKSRNTSTPRKNNNITSINSNSIEKIMNVYSPYCGLNPENDSISRIDYNTNNSYNKVKSSSPFKYYTTKNNLNLPNTCNNALIGNVKNNQIQYDSYVKSGHNNNNMNLISTTTYIGNNKVDINQVLEDKKIIKNKNNLNEEFSIPEKIGLINHDNFDSQKFKSNTVDSNEINVNKSKLNNKMSPYIQSRQQSSFIPKGNLPIAATKNNYRTNSIDTKPVIVFDELNNYTGYADSSLILKEKIDQLNSIIKDNSNELKDVCKKYNHQDHKNNITTKNNIILANTFKQFFQNNNEYLYQINIENQFTIQEQCMNKPIMNNEYNIDFISNSIPYIPNDQKNSGIDHDFNLESLANPKKSQNLNDNQTSTLIHFKNNSYQNIPYENLNHIELPDITSYNQKYLNTNDNPINFMNNVYDHEGYNSSNFNINNESNTTNINNNNNAISSHINTNNAGYNLCVKCGREFFRIDYDGELNACYLCR